MQQEPFDKTRHAKEATVFATPARDYYLLAKPRLAEAHDYGTVEPLTGAARSAPKTLANPNILHTQHLSDNQHRDVKNETHAKTQLVGTEGHQLSGLPKGRHEDEGVGRQDEGVGRQDEQGTHEAGTKQTDFLQTETEGAKDKAGTKQTDILQAETEGVKNYKAGTKKTNCLQAENEGAKYEAGTKQNDILQAKTGGDKHEAGTRQNNFIQAETEGNKHEAGTKQTNILQAETEGVYLKTKSYEEVTAPLKRLLNKYKEDETRF